MKLELLVDNEEFVAFNKPSGLLSIPDRFNHELPNLHKLAEAKYGKLFVVHRIDKDTSGVIIFAKNEQMHKYLNGLFQDRKVGKFYQAMVKGYPIEPKGSIDAKIIQSKSKLGTMMVSKSGLACLTDYEIKQKWNGFSLLQLQLHTGRTHQIRVHLKHIGHPVLCDPIYGDIKPILLSDFKKGYKLSVDQESELPILNRLALHANKLTFNLEDGTPISIEAPLIKDMAALVKQLNKWN